MIGHCVSDSLRNWRIYRRINFFFVVFFLLLLFLEKKSSEIVEQLCPHLAISESQLFALCYLISHCD